LKVTRITTRIARIELKNVYVFSHHIADAFRNVLVWLETDAGVTGIGEVSFSGSGGGVYEETPESAKANLDAYLAPAVVGEDVFDIERIHEKMDAAVPRNLVAKSGIDLALWDAMGKSLDMPAYKLLGGTHHEKIRCTYTLSIDTPDKMARQAATRREQGYTTVVVKVGRDAENDVERVKCVREAVGKDCSVRLDANEGYRPDQAIRILREVEKYEPEFIEEPVKHWDIEGMAMVARAIDMPVSSDESNNTAESVMRILDKRAASILNLKISKNGGLFRCKQIAAIAESAAVPIIVGGNTTFEIGRQASRHFAVATKAVDKTMGSEGCAPASQSKPEDLTTKWLKYEDVTAGKGYIEVIPGPGLGVELDEDKVRRYTVA
jgi:L-alanine-DL-glutamate epimerase-like enolase superfamily enzyme